MAVIGSSQPGRNMEKSVGVLSGSVSGTGMEALNSCGSFGCNSVATLLTKLLKFLLLYLVFGGTLHNRWNAVSRLFEIKWSMASIALRRFFSCLCRTRRLFRRPFRFMSERL